MCHDCGRRFDVIGQRLSAIPSRSEVEGTALRRSGGSARNGRTMNRMAPKRTGKRRCRRCRPFSDGSLCPRYKSHNITLLTPADVRPFRIICRLLAGIRPPRYTQTDVRLATPRLDGDRSAPAQPHSPRRDTPKGKRASRAARARERPRRFVSLFHFLSRAKCDSAILPRANEQPSAQTARLTREPSDNDERKTSTVPRSTSTRVRVRSDNDQDTGRSSARLLSNFTPERKINIAISTMPNWLHYNYMCYYNLSVLL